MGPRRLSNVSYTPIGNIYCFLINFITLIKIRKQVYNIVKWIKKVNYFAFSLVKF